ncbi:MAG TPA: HAD-IB family hydrolase [Gammaproteobacteria bacterium]|nr:HAD-IB family hydrolase [Gammaproteobacteria bacterium]
MKLAIFDIDGTLVRGSSERAFWRYLLMRGRQGPRQILAYLLFLVRYLPTGGIVTTKKNKAYLCGLRADEVAALARDFVRTRLRKRLFGPAVQRLEQHRRRGDTVVLMSGTLEPIARALGDELGVRHVCATLCSERHGVYLAQPPETHPYGAAKLSLAKQLAKQIDASLGQATAYGDSAQDLFLLEAVGEPVAVSPDRRLLDAALAKDWEIITAGGVHPAMPH